MRVVWIMAAHNNERTIAAAVRSIQSQTVSDWELVVVDDGSSDGTHQLLCELSQGDPRIHVLRNSQNLGLAESLNRAWRYLPADLLVRADADDRCYPERLEVQQEFMRRSPHVAVLGSAATLVNEQGQRLGDLHRPTNHSDLAARIFRENPFIHPTVVIRRSYLEMCDGYDACLKRSQDYDLWLRGYRRAYFHNLPQALVQYRLRPLPSWSAIYWGTRTLLKAVARERLRICSYWYPLRYLTATTLVQLRLRAHPAWRQQSFLSSSRPTPRWWDEGAKVKQSP